MMPEIPIHGEHIDTSGAPLELFPFNHAKDNPCDSALRNAAETVIQIAINHGLKPALRGNVLAAHREPAKRQLTERTRAAVHSSRTTVACGSYPVLPYKPPTPLIGACDVVIDGDEHDIEALFRRTAEALTADKNGVIYENDVRVPRRYQSDRQYVDAYERLKPTTRVSLDMTGAPEQPQLPLLTLRQTTQRIGMPVSSSSLSAVWTIGEYTTDSFYLAPSYHPLQRRRVDRTTNLDALSAAIYMDHDGHLAIRVPQIPDAVRFSEKAIAYYRQALSENNSEAAWAIIEAVCRSIRHACLFDVPWSDESINAGRSLIQQAALIVRNSYSPHRETAAQKLSDELLTACMYNPQAAGELIGQTGVHNLLAPPVSEAWNDPHRRNNIVREIAASLEVARRSNWPAGTTSSVIKGAINRVVYRTTPGILKPDPLIIA